MDLTLLPTVLVLEAIFLPYLSLSDIARFEVAAANKLLRIHFRVTYSKCVEFTDSDDEDESNDVESAHHLLPRISNGTLLITSFRLFDEINIRSSLRVSCANFMRWIALRNIVVSELEIYNPINENFGRAMTSNNYGKSIRNISILEENIDNSKSSIEGSTLLSIMYASSSSYLQSLSLQNLTKVKDNIFRTISRMFPLLIQLVLDNCSNVTDGTFISFVVNSPLLENISVNNLPHLTRLSIDAIPNNCKFLKSLKFYNLYFNADESMVSIIDNCTTIETLRLPNTCECIGDEGILAHMSMKSVNLKDLCLYGSTISGSGLFGLARKNGCCFDLINLDISYTVLADSLGYLSIGDMKNLKSLNVSGTSINDSELKVIIPKLINLNILSAVDYHEPDYSWINVLTNHNDSLCYLSLGCNIFENFSAQNFDRLANTMCNLCFLSLNHPGLTEEIVQPVISRHGEYLRDVNISSKIDMPGLASWIKSHYRNISKVQVN